MHWEIAEFIFVLAILPAILAIVTNIEYLKAIGLFGPEKKKDALLNKRNKETQD